MVVPYLNACEWMTFEKENLIEGTTGSYVRRQAVAFAADDLSNRMQKFS